MLLYCIHAPFAFSLAFQPFCLLSISRNSTKTIIHKTPKIVDLVIFSKGLDFFVWVVSFVAVLAYTLFCLLYAKKESSYSSWVLWLCLGSFFSLVLFLVDFVFATYVLVPFGMFVWCVLGFFGFGEVSPKRAFLFVLFGVLCILVFVESLVTLSWLWNMIALEVSFSSEAWKFVFLDVQLFNVFYVIVPLMFLVFLYSWVWIPSLRLVLTKVKRLKDEEGTVFSWFVSPLKLNRAWLAFLLGVFLLLTGFLVYYPVITSQGSVLVGSDSKHYFDVLSRMINEGPGVVVASDRPLTYFLLFFVKLVTGFSVASVVQIMPSIMACLLFLAVFWFVRTGTDNDVVSLVSAVFTSFSFQTTVGVYAYSLGNWFALVLLFGVLVFLLKALHKKSFILLLVSCLLGFTVFLAHPYTWYVLLGTLFVFLVSCLALIN